MLICVDLPLSSDAGGVINSVFGSFATSPAAWTNAIALFDEYRTLGMEVCYVPNDRYNRGVSVYTAPLYTVTDYDNSAALASYAGAASYASMRPRSLDVPWRHKALMSGVENSLFINTNAPVSTIFVKLYSTGLTVSTAYGRILIYLRIQFRGRGV